MAGIFAHIPGGSKSGTCSNSCTDYTVQIINCYTKGLHSCEQEKSDARTDEEAAAESE
jgi:hypothetical protein